MMKKRLVKLAATGILLVSIVGAVAGCGKKNEAVQLKVGVCAGPYGDMFAEAIQPSLEEQGYEIELVEFSDYVQPNNALAEKEIDVNMFQHSIYLENFKTEHNLDLVYLTEIPTAGMGIFSDNLASFDEVETGAVVAIPNDDTNLSRALRVLEQTGLITLDPAVDPAVVTTDDISENPQEVSFTEVNAEVLPSVLDSVDLAVINGNYALSAGLKLADALHNEELGEGYFNVIAVRTEDEDSQFAKDILSVVQSDVFRTVIEDENNQYVAFGRPSGY